MGDFKVDGFSGASVKSAAEMAGRFHAELISAMPEWERRLSESPGELEQLEREEHRSGGRRGFLNSEVVRRRPVNLVVSWQRTRRH